MAKKWKILIAFAVIAVVVTGITVPIVLNKDAIGAMVDGNKIYTLAHVKEAQQSALNELEAERQKTKEIIADYEKKLIEKETFWQDKYDNMVAEKDSEIARLRNLLEEARGYANTLENYMLTYFNLSYDSVDSAEMNSLMLEVFRNMEAQTMADFEDYEAELAKLPADIQSELDSLEAKISERESLSYVNSLSLIKNVVENSIIWGPNGMDFYFNGLKVGRASPYTYYQNKYTSGVSIENIDFIEHNPLYAYLIENGIFETQYNNVHLSILEIIELICLLNMSFDVNAPVHHRYYPAPDDKFPVVNYIDFNAQIETMNSRISTLNTEIADLKYMLYGEDGVDDGAIYLKGYYTSLKTQAEGSLKAIREKIQELEEATI